MLKEILRFFENFIKFYRDFLKFYRHFRENLENFGNMHSYEVWGTETPPPEASEIIKNLVEKSMETCKILKIFMNF